MRRRRDLQPVEPERADGGADGEVEHRRAERQAREQRIAERHDEQKEARDGRPPGNFHATRTFRRRQRNTLADGAGWRAEGTRVAVLESDADFESIASDDAETRRRRRRQRGPGPCAHAAVVPLMEERVEVATAVTPVGAVRVRVETAEGVERVAVADVREEYQPSVRTVGEPAATRRDPYLDGDERRPRLRGARRRRATAVPQGGDPPAPGAPRLPGAPRRSGPARARRVRASPGRRLVARSAALPWRAGCRAEHAGPERRGARVITFHSICRRVR